MNKRLLLSVAASAAVLAGCGGSDGSLQTDDSKPPASAGATAEGFVSYLQTLQSQLPDQATELDLSQFLPPTSETAEPTPVG